MRILVISDTHGRHDYLYRLLAEDGDFERILHLGDAEGGEEEICRAAPCPIEFVRGNADSFSDAADSRIITVQTHRIWMTHGHTDAVSRGIDRVVVRGCQMKADLILFGHTHQPFLEKHPGFTVLNPGSISFPRPLGKIPSYGVLEIGSDKKVRAEIRYITG